MHLTPKGFLISHSPTQIYPVKSSFGGAEGHLTGQAQTLSFPRATLPEEKLYALIKTRQTVLSRFNDRN